MINYFKKAGIDESIEWIQISYATGDKGTNIVVVLLQDGIPVTTKKFRRMGRDLGMSERFEVRVLQKLSI